MQAFSSTSKHAIAAMAVIGALLAQQAFAQTIWNWSYAGNNINASGTFTTSDATDPSGFYQITAITGSRNVDVITGLYPAGSAVPGNEPYALDNLIRIGAQGR